MQLFIFTLTWCNYLYLPWHDATTIHLPWHDATIIYSPWHDATIIHLPWHGATTIYFSWHDVAIIHLPRHDATIIYLPWHGATIIYLPWHHASIIYLPWKGATTIYFSWQDASIILYIYLDMLQVLFIYLDMIQLLYIYIAMMHNYIYWYDAIVIYSPLHVGWWLMVWQNCLMLQDSQVGSLHWESSQALLRGQSESVSQSKARNIYYMTRNSNIWCVKKENFREKCEILRTFFSKFRIFSR